MATEKGVVPITPELFQTLGQEAEVLERLPINVLMAFKDGRLASIQIMEDEEDD